RGAPMTTIPRPPKGLAAGGARLWRAVCRDYELEPVDLQRLATACLALDRAETAAAELRRDGIITTMPSGAKRPHPAVRIESEARTLLLRGLRELDIDASAIPEAKRPPALRSIPGGRSGAA